MSDACDHLYGRPDTPSSTSLRWVSIGPWGRGDIYVRKRKLDQRRGCPVCCLFVNHVVSQTTVTSSSLAWSLLLSQFLLQTHTAIKCKVQCFLIVVVPQGYFWMLLLFSLSQCLGWLTHWLSIPGLWHWDFALFLHIYAQFFHSLTLGVCSNDWILLPGLLRSSSLNPLQLTVAHCSSQFLDYVTIVFIIIIIIDDLLHQSDAKGSVFCTAGCWGQCLTHTGSQLHPTPLFRLQLLSYKPLWNFFYCLCQWKI